MNLSALRNQLTALKATLPSPNRCQPRLVVVKSDDPTSAAQLAEAERLGDPVLVVRPITQEQIFREQYQGGPFESLWGNPVFNERGEVVR